MPEKSPEIASSFVSHEPKPHAGARLLEGVRKVYERQPEWVQLVLRAGGLVAVMSVLDWSLYRVTRLPDSAYSEPVLFAQWGQHLWARPALLILLLPLAGLLFLTLRQRTLGLSWEAMPAGRRFRLLSALVAALLAWTYAFYSPNDYLGQLHLADRVGIVVGLGLLLWRPVFVWGFLLVLMPVIWQFSVPIGGLSWAEPFLLIRVLILIGVGYAARSVTRRVEWSDIVFVLFALIASHYWIAGLGKIQLEGWLTEDRLYYMLPSTYASGWLASLDPETISVWTRRLAVFNVPLKVFTIVVEFGAMFAMARRGLFKLFLLGWVGLHVGIFVVSGFCFWRWALLELGVFWLFAASRDIELPIFTRAHVALSVLLIVGSQLWFRPVKLAWRDVQATYSYAFEAETAEGERVLLPPRFFEPFSYPFTLGAFGYVATEPRLPLTGGGLWSDELAEQLANVSSAAEFFEMEREYGSTRVDSARIESLDSFVRRFVPARIQRGSPGLGMYFQAPPLLWTHPYRPYVREGTEVTRVVVMQKTALYGTGQYREIRNVPIHTIEMTPP